MDLEDTMDSNKQGSSRPDPEKQLRLTKEDLDNLSSQVVETFFRRVANWCFDVCFGVGIFGAGISTGVYLVAPLV